MSPRWGDGTGAGSAGRIAGCRRSSRHGRFCGGALGSRGPVGSLEGNLQPESGALALGGELGAAGGFRGGWLAVASSTMLLLKCWGPAGSSVAGLLLGFTLQTTSSSSSSFSLAGSGALRPGRVPAAAAASGARGALPFCSGQGQALLGFRRSSATRRERR